MKDMTPITHTIAATIWKMWNLLHIFSRYFSCDASLSNSRDAMVNCRDVWSRRVGYSTAAVAVGVILEVPEVIYELKWYIRKIIDRAFMRGTTPKKEEPEWFAVIGAIGLLLVVVGVTGEWQFDEYLSEANASIANFDHQQTIKAEKQAGSAEISAHNAAKDALDAQQTADSVATKAEELRRVLDAESPRYLLLSKAENNFIRSLSQFAGQRVRVMISGPLSSTQLGDEKSQTQFELYSLLGPDKAKWVIELDLDFVDKIGWQPAGFSVLVRTDASTRTKQAAKALSRELTKALPWQYSPVLSPIDPLGPAFKPESALGKMTKDRDLILVEIADRPIIETKKRQRGARKAQAQARKRPFAPA